MIFLTQRCFLRQHDKLEMKMEISNSFSTSNASFPFGGQGGLAYILKIPPKAKIRCQYVKCCEAVSSALFVVRMSGILM